MGQFDYKCECGGKSCNHVGGQLYESTVIIEVPLSDGTVVYLKGEYEQYGYVVVNEQEFYLKEFEEYFEDWHCDEDGFLLANKVWTYSELELIKDKFGDEEQGKTVLERECFDKKNKILTSFTPQIYDQCMRWKPMTTDYP